MTSTLVPQTVEIPDSADLTEILRRLSEADGSKPDGKAVQKPSKATDTIALTQDALNSLSELQSLLRAVELPSTRRPMSPRELRDVTGLLIKAKEAVKTVEAAVEGPREATFNHFDTTLESRTSTTDLAKDEKGHYLVKQEVYVPEHNVRLTRELREQSPEITAEELRDAWKAGDISRRDYMDATVHVEVPRKIDDEKFAALLKRKPSLLPKIAKLIKPGKVSAAFYVRPPKKD